MKRAFKNQRQPGSAVISAEGSRDLCIGTCSLAPPTTCPTLMTRERRAYGPTRASSDVPETGDGGGQWRRGARRGGRGARSLLGRIKVLNNCASTSGDGAHWVRDFILHRPWSLLLSVYAATERAHFNFRVKNKREINEVEQKHPLHTKQQ